MMQNAAADPFDQFSHWYDDALARDPEANAMALATVADGTPDVRMVLMRGLEHGPAFLGREAIVFYTNYESAKGQALAANPACTALFYWGRLEPYPGTATHLAASPQHDGPERASDTADFVPARQVRITGRASRVEAELSDAYFAGRPRLSQLGAWASAQSQTIADRDALVTALAAVEARFAENAVVPRPPNWGGFRIVAERVEFWQAQAGRLHDRIVYERASNGWSIRRLAP